MMKVVTILTALVAGAQAEAWGTTPRQEAHQNTSPKIKTYTSKDFVNPMPTPTSVVIETVKEADAVDAWVSNRVSWVNPEPNFPKLDISEYQVWRKQGLGGFSLRGFVEFGTTEFIDDRVVYDSEYQYKVRLVTQMGMGPFSDIVSFKTGQAPEGYTRPTSTTTPSQRMAAMRAKIQAEKEAAEQAAKAPEPEPEEDNGAFVVTTAPVEVVEEIVAVTAGGGDEAQWTHLVRSNDTQCTTGDCDDTVARTPEEQWFFQSLLSKVLGSTLTQAS